VAGARVVVDLVPGASPAPDARWAGVAVDVLRATSTLTRARESGAARIVPFASPGEAIAYREAHPGALACGERGGRIVPGFDLGNSPWEFDRERVGGRTLAFASTNGSRAMLALAGCGQRCLGAFVNASAVVRALAPAARVAIVCAGKEGAFALEDAACAGWIVRGLLAAGAEAGNDAARLVAGIAPRDAGEVRALVEGSEHARALAAMGREYARDVAFCATLDALDAVHDL
jgi:2-phosphosulfolactate phosphatase